jgi:hypothetical protein
LIIINGVFAINIPCFGSPLWENRSLWFWEEKVAFGLVVLARYCFAIKYPHLAINIRYSGIFFVVLKLCFYLCGLSFSSNVAGLC